MSTDRADGRSTMLPSWGSLRSSREASHHPPGDWAAVRSAIALVTETTGGLPDGTSLWLLGSAFDVQDPEASALEHLSLIHISEPTRLGMISYAVFCLKKKNKK